MKRRVITSVAGILLMLSVSAVNAGVLYANSGFGSAGTTLTFDEVVLASGTAMTNQYAAYGVTFNGAYYNSQTAFFAPATQGAQLGNFSPVNNPWSILFTNDVESAAFGMATNPNTTTVEALLNGVVVGLANAATDFDGTDFFQITGLVFDEIRISTSGDHLNLVDNLQFTAANSVPEPGSLALVSLALLGLVRTSRRKA
jgi:hypothetical protein